MCAFGFFYLLALLVGNMQSLPPVEMRGVAPPLRFLRCFLMMFQEHPKGAAVSVAALLIGAKILELAIKTLKS